MTAAALILGVVMLQGAPASPDQMAFGLDRLQWGMTAQAARGQYPALDGAAAEPGQPVSTLTLANYDAGPCRFNVLLTFDRGRLAEVELNSSGVTRLAACTAHIKRELGERYAALGGGFSTNQNGFSEYGSWGGKAMGVTYGALDGAFIKVTFRGAGR